MLRTIIDFEGFEGQVEIDLGKYRQRMLELSKLSLEINEEGKVDLKGSNLVLEVTKLYDIIHSKVKSVQLKHSISGIVITSLEELEDYQEYVGVMQKLIGVYNAGESLGNSLGKN